MKRVYTEITTADTKKTYVMDKKYGINPQLWEASISIKHVSDNGYTDSYISRTESIYLERETLEKAGLLPFTVDRDQPKPETVETAEDLIIRLLNHVGFYPTQE